MDRRRERYAESEPLLRRALVIRQKAQGVNHPDVAATLVRLASCLQAAKGKEAEAAGPMLRRAMTILEKSGDRARSEVTLALQGIAVWHMYRKEFDEAEAKLLQALAINEKRLATDGESGRQLS